MQACLYDRIALCYHGQTAGEEQPCSLLPAACCLLPASTLVIHPTAGALPAHAMPPLLPALPNRITVWCAGATTGHASCFAAPSRQGDRVCNSRTTPLCNVAAPATVQTPTTPPLRRSGSSWGSRWVPRVPIASHGATLGYVPVLSCLRNGMHAVPCLLHDSKLFL